MSEGFIKVYRCLMEWEWYHDSHMVHLFLHLLLTANHKPQRWKGMTVERGQLITGRLALSEATGISEQTCRTCLERLKSTGSISIRSTNRYSLITINNYERYQDFTSPVNQPDNEHGNQQLTSNQPAANQQVTTNKNDKKVKKEERESEERKNEDNTPADAEESVPEGGSRPIRARSCKSRQKPDFSEGSVFKNPGFFPAFCAGQWFDWCKNKKAPYRTQEVAEEALGYLYELSKGDEALATEALRIARISDWQSFHWHFKHLNKNDHDNHQPLNGQSHHGADNLRWLESHA